MCERDERKPDYDTLKMIADYFEVTAHYLLGQSTTSNISEREVDLQALKADMEDYKKEQKVECTAFRSRVYF